MTIIRSIAKIALLVWFILFHTGCSDVQPTPEQGKEYVDPNEAAVTAALIKSMQSVSLQRKRDDLVRRFNQPKSLGCFDASVVVPTQSDPALAQGLFGIPGTYPARVRFASATKWDDRKKDFRGMSIKIFDVPGNVLYGRQGVQDILLNSYPALFASNASQFLAFVRATEADRVWAYFLKPSNWKSLWIAIKGRSKPRNPLTTRYWSTTPYRFGSDTNTAVKFSATPCQGAPEIEIEDREDGLSLAMEQHLGRTDACFDLMVQFQGDPKQMPIENASVVWDETKSPFRKVATLRIAAGQSFRSEPAMRACEVLSFNPWQSLVAHQPLGGINRVRRESYAALAAFRGADAAKMEEIQGDDNAQDN